MDRRHDIRLALLALAILVGLGLQAADGHAVATCDTCAAVVDGA
ncbi:hypothetical protein [Jannaschia sp. S6380]|nr:hypothetical protein [Jannaschia sp. S6380]